MTNVMSTSLIVILNLDVVLEENEVLEEVDKDERSEYSKR